ncbi:MAG: LytR/AlgR family response regulator transcription factor [Clostridia bacterium]
MYVFCFDGVESPFQEILKSTVLAMKNEDIRFYVNESIANIIKLAPEDYKSVFFIDTRIRVRKQSGFFLAASLREKFPRCHIVFISSHPEDMSLCLKNLLRPSGFILKPSSNFEVSALLGEIGENIRKQTRAKMLYISTHEFKRSINVDNIVYFATSGKKLFCKTVLGEELEFYETITNLQNRFGDMLLRCHHGFLVNKLYIKGTHKGSIELDCLDETLPISEKYRKEVMEYVKKIV